MGLKTDYKTKVRMVKYKNKPNYSKQYNVDGSILEVFPDKTTKLTKKKE